ncbi:hypothetical protein K439DRAFT_1620750 [Ramaria rubella]|nr:hypothetical protein K439DRAFT_1620750 [Ramaria rubella]
MCRGICSVVDSATDKDGSQDDSSEAKAGSGKATAVLAKQGRWDLCEGGIEITAEDLTTATIWQFGKHPDVKPEQGLHWSRHLRNLVSEWLHVGGAKVSTVQKGEVGFLYLAHCLNLPTAKQLRSMFPAVWWHKHLHKDLFEVVHLLHEQNPDKIYNYTAHERKQLETKSEFTCAITDKHALEQLILHGIRDGIGCDTSWRNKNENRAAVMFLMVVDGNGHLAPGSALLSANIKTETLIKYLKATMEQVITRSQDIVRTSALKVQKIFHTWHLGTPSNAKAPTTIATVPIQPERPLSKSDSLTVVAFEKTKKVNPSKCTASGFGGCGMGRQDPASW